jgi:hypothetical protein
MHLLTQCQLFNKYQYDRSFTALHAFYEFRTNALTQYLAIITHYHLSFINLSPVHIFATQLYSPLLESLGIDTIYDFSRREPRNATPYC